MKYQFFATSKCLWYLVKTASNSAKRKELNLYFKVKENKNQDFSNA